MEASGSATRTRMTARPRRSAATRAAEEARGASGAALGPTPRRSSEARGARSAASCRRIVRRRSLERMGQRTVLLSILFSTSIACGDGGPGLSALAEPTAVAESALVGQAPACPTNQGLVRCDNQCVPAAVDPVNCGGCGHHCGKGQVCTLGRCSTSFASEKGGHDPGTWTELGPNLGGHASLGKVYAVTDGAGNDGSLWNLVKWSWDPNGTPTSPVGLEEAGLRVWQPHAVAAVAVSETAPAARVFAMSEDNLAACTHDGVAWKSFQFYASGPEGDATSIVVHPVNPRPRSPELHLRGVRACTHARRRRFEVRRAASGRHRLQQRQWRPLDVANGRARHPPGARGRRLRRPLEPAQGLGRELRPRDLGVRLG